MSKMHRKTQSFSILQHYEKVQIGNKAILDLKLKRDPNFNQIWVYLTNPPAITNHMEIWMMLIFKYRGQYPEKLQCIFTYISNILKISLFNI
jgi:hypothetical protein